ncbi:hypothetical protein PCANC_07506 [Puccinia coronata f. sp. avenae]|uniref:Uncharacterized protein n=1 Tax=Puccinia coronata f. sp. avenae TaxID=200324 RepID=A0A2N5VTC1_9BASI|nr:hypothetical protein PCANC_07506 [Puccinia coronata f. sp. avenae]
MEIDAATVRRGPGNSSIFELARAICRAKNLCFRCLKPTVPFTHTGSLDCPNQGVTWEQRKAFIAKHCSNSSTLVSAVDIASVPVGTIPQLLTYRSPPEPVESSPDPAVDPKAPILGNHQGFDKIYEEFNSILCTIKEVPIATVHVRLDCTKKGCLLVPASFKGPEGVWAGANILVDTGAMANFISDEFVRRHNLPLWSQKNPIQCVGFDGKEGVGGLVTQDWVGVIRLSTTDSKPVTLGSSFGVTRLGSINVIFGLPWLDRQGWIASGSMKGGHQFTLGSTPLYVMESLPMHGQPGGKNRFVGSLR